jgi:hypothetical protein
MKQPEPRIQATGPYPVDASSTRTIDLDDIRRRRAAIMPDGGHGWVIQVVFALDDPETALDHMELGADKLVGFTDIHCLLCQERYTTTNRYHKCPQHPPND